jgi:hypothetical protein
MVGLSLSGAIDFPVGYIYVAYDATLRVRVELARRVKDHPRRYGQCDTCYAADEEGDEVHN